MKCTNTNFLSVAIVKKKYEHEIYVVCARGEQRF